MSTLLLKLTLKDSRPSVWRTLRVPTRYRLDQLHRMMQILFDWQDYHLHEFVIGEVRYTDLETLDGWEENEDERVSLRQALGRRKSFLYHYDFGDSWEVAATVLETLPDDQDAPECVDGAMAGPPEDCGGIPGFTHLKKVLANPRHPEHESMKVWAPKGWSADRFAPDSLNKKLVRAFGRKRSGPKASPEATLAGYRLVKLRPGQAAVAALEESGPRSLEEIGARLTELGYPLTGGAETLRRSLSKMKGIRQRQDGKLELVPGTALARVQSTMRRLSQEGTPPPARPPLPIEPVAPSTVPISAEELESARPFGFFPPPFSVRRKLIVTLDSHGGEASYDSIVSSLLEMKGPWNHIQEARIPVSVDGCLALHLRDGILTLDRSHGDTLKARARFREWLAPHLQRQQDLQQSRQAYPARMQQLEAERLAEWHKASCLSRAVVAACCKGERFALVLLDARTEAVQTFSQREPAQRAVASYGILAGLDPRSLLEKLGWSFQGETVDLTPPFKSRPVGRDRRKSVKMPEAIEMTTGQRPVDPKQLEEWLEEGQQRTVEAALLQDAHNLRRLWRYGVLHGGVRRDLDQVEVAWNPGKDFSLGSLLRWSMEDGRPVRLTMRDGTSVLFQRTDPELKELYTGQLVVLGRSNGSHRVEPLILENVMDADYPIEISEERIRKLYFW
jgi:hypothetical protein